MEGRLGEVVFFRVEGKLERAKEKHEDRIVRNLIEFFGRPMTGETGGDEVTTDGDEGVRNCGTERRN